MKPAKSHRFQSVWDALEDTPEEPQPMPRSGTAGLPNATTTIWNNFSDRHGSFADEYSTL